MLHDLNCFRHRQAGFDIITGENSYLHDSSFGRRLRKDPHPIASFFKRFRNIKSAVAKQQKTQFPKWRYLNSKGKEIIVRIKRGLC
jgi:hypothetical protein